MIWYVKVILVTKQGYVVDCRVKDLSERCLYNGRADVTFIYILANT